MSFASEQYLKWAESQFEQTGIAQNDFCNTGGGINSFKKYKRDAVDLSVEAKQAFKIIHDRTGNDYNNLLTQETTEQEKGLSQYFKDCETMDEQQAREKHLNLKK